ncbi:hypothetical protein PsYK624_157370 [Phanerochaete sordida]|uniref:Uncharacterized protein n=1 Tax=Phanerochaete sordida TaxID=48140 RepID=A0A9P3GR01_9APHY|nr:hypothetical protein PsYK624_157370 [Phanerochaete sordida]
MPSRYYTRSAPLRSPEAALDTLSDLERDFEATSTIGRPSSPPYLSDDEETLRQHCIQQRVDITQLAGPLKSDSDDDEIGEHTSPTNKTLAILKLMSKKYPRFSLRSFILELFTLSNGDLKAAAGNFTHDGGVFQLMQVFWELSTHWQRGKSNPRVAPWVVSPAAEVVDQEFSWLTNRASEGPHYAAAESLRVSAEHTTVDLVHGFELPKLTQLYGKTLSHFQHILHAAIGREDDEIEDGEDVIAGDQEGTGISGHIRNNARTIATSITLNMRSRNTINHAVVNAPSRLPRTEALGNAQHRNPRRGV